MSAQINNNINNRQIYTDNIGRSETDVVSKNKFSKQPQISPADEFISSVKAEKGKFNNGNFLSRNFWSSTAILPPFLGLMTYEFLLLRNLSKITAKKDLKAYKNTALKKFGLATVGAFTIACGLQKYFSSQKDNNYNNIKQYFNSVNKTNAKLSKNTFRSMSMGAFYSPASGEIYLNENIINDPYMRLKNKRIIKHELVHAKQYETIARSKDGIKKVNYICTLNLVNMIKNNPNLAEDFEKIYTDIKNEKSGKYNNVKLETNSGDLNFKNYIEAVHILLNSKDATYNDIPIFINQEHYENVIKKEGALSKDEEEKANKYFEAGVNYPTLGVVQLFNPFSDYNNNLLEKEAYKENPWYTRII